VPPQVLNREGDFHALLVVHGDVADERVIANLKDERLYGDAARGQVIGINLTNHLTPCSIIDLTAHDRQLVDRIIGLENDDFVKNRSPCWWP
jgi:hypothetical protein